jgi:hypothetical protein
MQTYRLKTTVSNDGTITIKKLPFRAGDEVEIVVRSRERWPQRDERYPLRGEPIRYASPFESVAEGDWDVLQ